MTKPKARKKADAAIIERMAEAIFDHDEVEAAEECDASPRAWADDSVCDEERDYLRNVARIALAAQRGEKPAPVAPKPKVLGIAGILYAVLEDPVRYELHLSDGTEHRLPLIQSLVLRFADNVLGAASGKAVG